MTNTWTVTPTQMDALAALYGRYLEQGSPRVPEMVPATATEMRLSGSTLNGLTNKGFVRAEFPGGYKRGAAAHYRLTVSGRKYARELHKGGRF